MSSSRWDPWGDVISLQDAMNNLLEESLVRSRSDTGMTVGTLGLAIDLLETPDAYILTASVPGVKPSEVTITVLGDTLTIGGTRPEPRQGQPGPEGSRWLVRERHFGAFDRSVKLPTAVRTDDANAEFEDGVLTVTLPKAEEAKPRIITVRSAGPDADTHRIDVETMGASTDHS